MRRAAAAPAVSGRASSPASRAAADEAPARPAGVWTQGCLPAPSVAGGAAASLRHGALTACGRLDSGRGGLLGTAAGGKATEALCEGAAPRSAVAPSSGAAERSNDGRHGPASPPLRAGGQASNRVHAPPAVENVNSPSFQPPRSSRRRHHHRRRLRRGAMAASGAIAGPAAPASLPIDGRCSDGAASAGPAWAGSGRLASLAGRWRGTKNTTLRGGVEGRAGQEAGAR